MLQHLTIHNYALISELDIDFGEGFSVLTGETGAGKSIILGALALLMGGRADTSAITEGEQRCVIEGEFDSCIIRRELYATGKSRSFVDDSPVTLAELKPLAAKLIDIHSQHENLLLSNPEFCLSIVDTLARDEEEKQSYAAAYAAWREAEAALAQLRREAAEAQKNADYLSYRYQQLSEAHLQAGELETLEEEQRRLSAAEDIRSGYGEALSCLMNDNGEGAIQAVKAARNALKKISEFLPAEADLLNRLEAATIELKDISETVEHELNNAEADPHRLEAVEERIGELSSLCRKFGVETTDELLAEQQRLEQLIGRNDSFDFDIAQLEKQLKTRAEALGKAADSLTKKRLSVAPLMKERLEESLSRLGVRHAAISLQVTPLPDYTESGHDEVVLLFAANLNQTLRPVSEVASGGEMARLMLSVKTLVADRQGLPTVIFDEVDTGVSGEVAEEMAKLMLEMAHGRQVLAITHLPQIAAKGQHHYKVYKQDTATRTETHIRRLTQDERPAEVAMLLSGATITDEALNNAKRLLEN